jgi:MFS family permease
MVPGEGRLVEREAKRARGAVAALFFANGALYANVVPRLPDLKASLGLSNTAFGTAIGAYGLGALVLGLLGGVLVRRFGSRRVAWVSTVAIAGNLVLIGLAPSWLAFACVLAVAGALDAYADIGANAHGLRVERLYGRSILNSLHGVWSIGAVAGGIMGAAAAGLGVEVAVHLAIAAALFAGFAVVVSRFLLRGPDAVAPPAARRGLRLVGSGVLAFGLIAAMAQIMEEATATWGSIYLRGELGAAAAVGGLGFIALQSTQTVGRLLGDRVVTRFGDRAVARAGALLAGGAMTVALLVPGVAVTIVAFGLVGAGIGTLIPAGLRGADALLPNGMGLMLVGTVLRLAVLVAPPLIGVVADAESLRVALLVIPGAALLVVLLSPALSDGGR